MRGADVFARSDALQHQMSSAFRPNSHSSSWWFGWRPTDLLSSRRRTAGSWEARPSRDSCGHWGPKWDLGLEFWVNNLALPRGYYGGKMLIILNLNIVLSPHFQPCFWAPGFYFEEFALGEIRWGNCKIITFDHTNCHWTQWKQESKDWVIGTPAVVYGWGVRRS